MIGACISLVVVLVRLAIMMIYAFVRLTVIMVWATVALTQSLMRAHRESQRRKK